MLDWENRQQPNLWRHLLAYAASIVSLTPLSIVISDAAGNQILHRDPDFAEKEPDASIEAERPAKSLDRDRALVGFLRPHR
jgi:hypothetical protein